MKQLIHININDPRNLLWNKKSTKASAIYNFCELTECPLLENNKCLFNACKYHESIVHTGFTIRAKKFYDFLNRHKVEEEKLNTKISRVSENDAFIQIENLVYVPFNFLNLDSNGNPQQPELFSHKKVVFNAKDILNLEWIEKIFSFVPRTILDNREIKNYRQIELPKLLEILRKNQPKLWEDIEIKKPYISKFLLESLGEEKFIVPIDCLPLNINMIAIWNGNKGKISTGCYSHSREKYIWFQWAEEKYDCLVECWCKKPVGMIEILKTEDILKIKQYLNSKS